MSRQKQAKRGIVILPSEFKANIRGAAPAHIVEAWRKYQGTRDAQARNVIWTFYLPLCYAVAVVMKRRKPDFFHDDLDVLISDGIVGLNRIIDYFHVKEVDYFPPVAMRGIRSAIRTEAAKRLGAGFGYTTLKRIGFLGEIRQQLTQSLGRMPDREEIEAEFGKKIINPNFYLETPRSVRFSELTRDDDDRPFEIADERSAEMGSRQIDVKQFKKIALKGFHGADLKALKMLLKGNSYTDVARVLGVSRQRSSQRINGLLWQLRQRAELAKFADIDEVCTTAQTEQSGRVLMRKTA